ncbi:EF-hand domain-containing protein [Nocardiopsis sp. HUAS JQ3]|uniref:EF-hand domain-containing protein n=1 Tax=Nocardiopsis sp. HUAS JQ3 TaxID=3061629 RepID=UPI0023A9B424|nr:EF-hand domain-containing protein [Nocardiopsis sp. HUAS JQ3]WDZ90284.1 EF-hand domain-containing protein [Nocardiopsis sp. HUAS JQ3]
MGTRTADGSASADPANQEERTTMPEKFLPSTTTEQEARDLFTRLDTDKDGSINIHEWLAYAERDLGLDRMSALHAFALDVDTDHDLLISQDEFVRIGTQGA